MEGARTGRLLRTERAGVAGARDADRVGRAVGRNVQLDVIGLARGGRLLAWQPLRWPLFMTVTVGRTDRMRMGLFDWSSPWWFTW